MRPAIRALLLSFILPSPALQAQAAPDRTAILAVVSGFFDGMRSGDSGAIRAMLHPRALLATAVVRQGTAGVEFDGIEEVLTAIGTPHDSVWDERLSNQRVLQDGTLAIVWTDYHFYVGSRFNHCGVDAFTLAKEGDGWKIIALTDTRRRQGCGAP